MSVLYTLQYKQCLCIETYNAEFIDQIYTNNGPEKSLKLYKQYK